MLVERTAEKPQRTATAAFSIPNLKQSECSIPNSDCCSVLIPRYGQQNQSKSFLQADQIRAADDNIDWMNLLSCPAG